MLDHLARLFGLAVVDSVNLLAFAVIGGLWLGTATRRHEFLGKAARFTGGAFCGIVTLSVLVVWLVGANQDLVHRGLYSRVVMVVFAIIGLGLTVLGWRTSIETKVDTVDAPLARGVMHRFGLPVTGFVLGVVQSGTSVPFGIGMVVISLAEQSVLYRVVEIVFFALVAIAPSATLIVALSRVPTRRIAAASAMVDGFMARGRVLGRWLTITVGLALLTGSVWQFARIAGWI